MKQRLDKLLSVKSIITIFCTLIFTCLTLRGTISGQEFLTVFTVVVGFYFGTQAERKNGGDAA
ncbi:MAG: hypothetical protein IJD20_01830 [Oscillospiraceae bacterium]|nr:hypothetical protein [Oscillospiraceae bacterium]MBR2081342.1 hypothetical protein [Oscillospiraceae bacterium]MBR2366759.1 hypothetical protein [Oscillospiraceae bacterium]MBR2976797.1 hypothetical protein [Oscillospiraceae bacterium]